MPQAPTNLRVKFPGGLEEANEVLASVCTFKGGVIRPKEVGAAKRFSEREWDAIDYLIQEWDYAYAEKPLVVE